MQEVKTFEAELDNCVVEAEVQRGCPQGGLLSPLLYNLVVHDLLNNLRTEFPEAYSQGFADNLAVLIRGIDPEKV